MAVEFYDLQHARDRLIHSIIRINNTPVMIIEVDKGNSKEKYKISYNLLGKTTLLITNYPNKEVDFSPVPLGFINMKKDHCMTGIRMPMRTYKIGLSKNNLALYNPHIKAFSRTTYIFNSKEIAYTISNRYPSLDKAIELIKEGLYATCAFNRVFAIDLNGNLIHKYHGIVGSIHNKPKLSTDFGYLSELLSKFLPN